MRMRCKQIVALSLTLCMLLEPGKLLAVELEDTTISGNDYSMETVTISENDYREEPQAEEEHSVDPDSYWKQYFEEMQAEEELENVGDDFVYVYDEYGFYYRSQLIVDGHYFVYSTEGLLQTTLEDGQGGSITFDPVEKILTLNNYHFDENNDFFALRIVALPDLTIILNGTSVIHGTSMVERASQVSILSTNCRITGSGTLETNRSIGGGDGLLTFDGCNINVNGDYAALIYNDIYIKNAIIDLSVRELAFYIMGDRKSVV